MVLEDGYAQCLEDTPDVENYQQESCYVSNDEGPTNRWTTDVGVTVDQGRHEVEVEETNTLLVEGSNFDLG